MLSALKNVGKNTLQLCTEKAAFSAKRRNNLPYNIGKSDGNTCRFFLSDNLRRLHLITHMQSPVAQPDLIHNGIGIG